jgi:hypothetical protein
MEFDRSIQENIVEKLVFTREGTLIKPFEGSNHTLGCLILQFDSAAEMLEKMESMDERVRVHTAKRSSANL